MTLEEFTSIIEVAVAETMNQLEHNYGIAELESIGHPTVREITTAIVSEHYASPAN